jgi:predicted Zn-dependent peptidase
MKQNDKKLSVNAVSKKLLAVVAGAALLGAAPAPQTRYPTAFATDLGVTKLIAESDADSPISGVQMFVAAGLDREPVNGNGLSALVAECVTRTPVSPGGPSVLDAVAEGGGSLSYTVDGRSVHYYLEARSEHLPALVALFAKALAAPDFSAEAISLARTALAARQTEFEANPLSVGIQMFRRTYYATSAGGPALGTTATLALLSSKDVGAFYAANYKRGAVFSSVVGNFTPALGDALKQLAAGLPDGAAAPVTERSRPIPVSAPRIVAHRDVQAPWVVVGFAAPAPNSRDFGAMLVLQSLLSAAFERNNATSESFLERSVGAFYLYDSTPASLVVYVNGSQVDPSLALRELLLVSHSLSMRPLAAAPLRHFKAIAEGQFLSDSVNLADRSYLLGTFSSQGLGDDSINAALGSLQKTTGTDVERVAKTYLQRYIVALVLPRQE